MGSSPIVPTSQALVPIVVCRVMCLTLASGHVSHLFHQTDTLSGSSTDERPR